MPSPGPAQPAGEGHGQEGFRAQGRGGVTARRRLGRAAEGREWPSGQQELQTGGPQQWRAEGSSETGSEQETSHWVSAGPVGTRMLDMAQGQWGAIEDSGEGWSLEQLPAPQAPC